jgi:hypothetical protein
MRRSDWESAAAMYGPLRSDEGWRAEAEAALARIAAEADLASAADEAVEADEGRGA